MPPRLLPKEYGFLDTVRHDNAESVWMKGEVVNSLAAMPSMHFGKSTCHLPLFTLLTSCSRLLFLHRLHFVVSLWSFPAQSHQGRGSQIGVLEDLVCFNRGRLPAHGTYRHCFNSEPLLHGCDYGHSGCGDRVLLQSYLLGIVTSGGLSVMVSSHRKADTYHWRGV